MKRVLGRWAILGALLSLVMWAAGCGPGGSAPGVDSGAAPSATGNDINPVARDRLEDGGTLRWPLTAVPNNFNFNEVDGLNINTYFVMGALMPSVFVFDAAGAPVLRTDYVESAELIATSPRQVVTYRINPSAIWSDGTPITEADFEAQWRALRSTNSGFEVASTRGYDKIQSVTKGRDDREVVVTFGEPYADWQGLFAPLYPASANFDPNIFNDGWKEKPLVTAGPFAFERVDQAARTVTLVRNDRWWGRPAKLDRIVFRAIEPDAQIDALANGEIDFIDIGPDVDNLRRAEDTPGITVHRAGGSNFAHITLNGASEALRDVRVRRALAMSIDRATITRAVIGPLGIPPTPLGNHILMPTQQGYQDNSGDIGRYDPEVARALLEEAGWRLEGAVRAKDGRQLTLRYVIRSQVTADRRAAELVQGMLGEVGVKVDIEPVPGADFFEDYLKRGNFDLTSFTWFGSVFPISASRSLYSSPKPGPDGQLDVQQNYARVGSPELDRLFDRAIAEFDPMSAIETANEIDRMIWQEVHSLPLYQVPDIVASKSSLANYGAFGFASVIYEDLGFITR